MLAEGSLLSPNSSFKVKGINLEAKLGSNWGGFWGHDWDPVYNQNIINAAKGLGVNTVKWNISGFGPNGDNKDIQWSGGPAWPVAPGIPADPGQNVYPSDIVLQQRLQSWLSMVQAAGLASYVNMCTRPFALFGQDGSKISINLPILQKVVGWLESASKSGARIIGIDLANEIDYQGPTTWGCVFSTNPVYGLGGGPTSTTTGYMNKVRSDCAMVLAAARQMTKLPLTFSVLCDKNNSTTYFLNNVFLDLQYDIGCDYHCIHPYWGGVYGYPQGSDVAATSYGAPLQPAGQYGFLPADAAVLEGRPKFLGRYLMGEFGAIVDPDLTTNLPRPNNIIAAKIDLVGQQSIRTASLGSVIWCLTPYVPEYMPWYAASRDSFAPYDATGTIVTKPSVAQAIQAMYLLA